MYDQVVKVVVQTFADEFSRLLPALCLLDLEKRLEIASTYSLKPLNGNV